MFIPCKGCSYRAGDGWGNPRFQPTRNARNLHEEVDTRSPSAFKLTSAVGTNKVTHKNSSYEASKRIRFSPIPFFRFSMIHSPRHPHPRDRVIKRLTGPQRCVDTPQLAFCFLIRDERQRFSCREWPIPIPLITDDVGDPRTPCSCRPALALFLPIHPSPPPTLLDPQSMRYKVRWTRE